MPKRYPEKFERTWSRTLPLTTASCYSMAGEEHSGPKNQLSMSSRSIDESLEVQSRLKACNRCNCSPRQLKSMSPAPRSLSAPPRPNMV